MDIPPQVTRTEIEENVKRSQELSVQTKPTAMAGMNVITLAYAGEFIAPWWSGLRDRQLRAFWKGSDALAGAVYAMVAKMTAIPRRVVPIDSVSRRARNQAYELQEYLDATPEFGEGWSTWFGNWVMDLLTQDNGSFAEIIGEGSKDGPIVGRPYSIANLDAQYCQRTGNPEYPVIYYDISGGMYKLHYSRVMYKAQLRSPQREMFGVGLCAVSRAVNVAQTLVDIQTFKQEKLGSRPRRQILITQGGLSPTDVELAFSVAEGTMDSMGLRRYSKTVLVGDTSLVDADIKTIDLSSVPDGFNEFDSVTIGMATIALAFGVDAREFFPAMSSGATRADALIQHLKQRGKGPGEILELTEAAITQKYLPPGFRLEFDFQDDAQDRQQAEIRKIRAERINFSVNASTLDIHTARLKMLQDGDLSDVEYAELELRDGRLENGTTVLSLFYTDDENLSKYLHLPAVADPLDVQANDVESTMTKIKAKLKDARTDIVNMSRPKDIQLARLAEIALMKLEEEYEGEQKKQEFLDGQLAQQQPGADNPGRPPKQTQVNNQGAQGATAKVADRNQRTRSQAPNVQPQPEQMTNEDSRCRILKHGQSRLLIS